MAMTGLKPGLVSGDLDSQSPQDLKVTKLQHWKSSSSAAIFKTVSVTQCKSVPCDCASVKMSHLSETDGVLRCTADEVELPQFPELDRAVGSSPAAHRFVEGVTASLTGGSTQPLRKQTKLVTFIHALQQPPDPFPLLFLLSPD